MRTRTETLTFIFTIVGCAFPGDVHARRNHQTQNMQIQRVHTLPALLICVTCNGVIPGLLYTNNCLIVHCTMCVRT